MYFDKIYIGHKSGNLLVHLFFEQGFVELFSL